MKTTQQWLDEYRGRSLVGHFTQRDFLTALDGLQAALDAADGADLQDGQDGTPEGAATLTTAELRSAIAGALAVQP